MDFYAVLYTEINLISILVIIFLLSKASEIRNWPGYYSFRAALSCMMLFIFADMISLLMIRHLMPYSNASILIFKTIYFVSMTFMGYHSLIYFEKKGNTEIGRNPKHCLALAFISLIHFVMAMMNFRMGFFFHMTANGLYERGPLFIVQYVFSYVYVAIAITRAIYFSVAKTNYIDRHYIITLALFPILPTAASLIQFRYPQIPVLCIAITMAAFLVYQDELENLVYIDPLTGLKNRRSFMRQVSEKMDSYEDRAGLYLMMIDVDYFKEINDTYGHISGDQALVLVADVLRKSLAGLELNAVLGRYGGDEFIALLETSDESVAAAYEQTIQEQLKFGIQRLQLPYSFTLSIGYIAHDASYQLVNDFVNAADTNLYTIKQQHHRQRPQKKIS